MAIALAFGSVFVSEGGHRVQLGYVRGSPVFKRLAATFVVMHRRLTRYLLG